MKSNLIKLILILIMVSCKEEKPFIVIGHRGAMGHIMENTLPSVQKALDLKVDWIEIDVFVCKTGELVVFHDEILDSLSTSTGKIEDLTLAEIKKVELNGGYSIPTLKEVIELINQKVPLNIELKGKNTAKPTFELLNQYYKNGFRKENFIISSFLWEELEIFYNLDKDIKIGVLTEDNPLNAIPFAEKINANAINPWHKKLSQNNIETIKNKGFEIYTYTVNDTSDINIMKKMGVNGIFTNYPERVIK